MKNYLIDIVIDLDEIQQAIYTEGTWHPADNATAWGVNATNEPIVDRRVREGLDDLLARISGYIVSQTSTSTSRVKTSHYRLPWNARHSPHWPTM